MGEVGIFAGVGDLGSGPKQVEVTPSSFLLLLPVL